MVQLHALFEVVQRDVGEALEEDRRGLPAILRAHKHARDATQVGHRIHAILADRVDVRDKEVVAAVVVRIQHECAGDAMPRGGRRGAD